MTSSTIKNNNNNNTDNNNRLITDTVQQQMTSCESNNSNNSHSNKSTSRNYQVATPKSPHDLVTLSSTDDHENLTVDCFRTNYIPIDLMEDQTHSAINKDSEEIERMKYSSVKSELLDIVNLQCLLSRKEKDNIRNEINRIDAQIELIKQLHNDNTLYSKIDKYKQEQIEINKKMLRARSLQEKWQDHVFPSGSLQLNMGGSIHIPKHHYQTRSKSHGNLLDTELFEPEDDSILNERSTKRQKLANTTTPSITNSQDSTKSILKSGKKTTKSNGFEIHKFTPNQMNTHHRRVYSTSCLSNNSGIIGQTDANEPIFRRYDGILVIITCSFCQRANFTSAQGIVNHTRLKHHKTYSSQPLTVLFNQNLLPEDKQDPEILAKFKKLNLDPHKDYLPYNIAIPTMDIAPKMGSSKNAHLTDHLSIEKNQKKKTENKEVYTAPPKKIEVNHLKALYKEDDLDELVNIIDESRKDLQVILDQPSDDDDESEEEEKIVQDDVSKDEDYVSNENPKDDSDGSDYDNANNNSDIEDENKESSFSPASSPIASDLESTTPTHPLQNKSPQMSTRVRNLRKVNIVEPPIDDMHNRLRSKVTKDATDENNDITRRLRNADTSHVNNFDEGDITPLGDERSSGHYNLRLRSNLRQTSR
ncbi:similar to Saccharomyces cerevisiae YOR023C AHC1 Subunit of the Ada histone acetyltransferase complex, required for structural integrity of the complex [Maudiozyma barnettii]|uniref:Similar to Saccharomyces cerevisiae YOR023C AHC1 Subunit of the Ada histone acetyltransferase complex, required for structural integrity of the complex n=1 Tax=Maudiozyma barnettii TaxID=61262 RepID=A0A8H2ZLP3_9SACH|nr:Ahc1p [Kazachstania barnettii]CAB4256312.1 similar to Saccharomyces cerevisiae YOR023C AHC1 Subunit of the Ada histone acetyltransferase complex, required for structural integrity of the complex [Kazachstania barnettii]CAD1784921.1 similar to Saccharomyces cerevisiae YOR023C AHC1 Subunit of the Ada histone acetyltransferase complex, required for structural integrity of the complex [Kazachstania barnettii]